jgi:hypothetical protein
MPLISLITTRSQPSRVLIWKLIQGINNNYIKQPRPKNCCLKLNSKLNVSGSKALFENQIKYLAKFL